MLVLAAAALAGAPTIAEGALLAPTFTLTGGLKWSAGAAFVAESTGGPVVVTTLESFGPRAGLQRQASYEEVRRRAGVAGVDRLTGRQAVASGEVFHTPNAGSSDDDPATDIVAFRLVSDKKGRAGGKLRVAPLAVVDGCPAAGTSLWVPGSSLDAAQGVPWFEARVEQCNERELTFRYSLHNGTPPSPSGAPLLDEAGQVRGMVSQASRAQEAGLGVAMSGTALRAHLSGQPLAAKAPPPPPPSPWGTLDTGWTPIANPWGYDLPGLHAKLLPEWGLAGTHDAELKAGIKAPELAPLFNEIARLSWADNMGNFRRIVELMRRWNTVYRDAGVPLRMNAGARGQTLAWMTWWVSARATVQLGDRTVPADIVGRVDRLNVADAVPTLIDGDVGVVVPLDDLRDDALYGLWKRLDPAAKDRLARALTAELQGVVDAEGLAVLVRTAPLRRELDAVRTAIGKRTACSNYAVSRLPWWGVDAALETRLAGAVSSSKCAAITASELARLRAATAALADPLLEPALRKLEAHLARSVALEGAGMRLACDDCGWEGRVGSGLVAALSDPPTRVTATARLCDRAATDPTLDAALDALGTCAGADVTAAITAQWPTAWGERKVNVEGVPAELPVRWPRDATR